ncbi:MAG: hypothetical protein KIT84_13505 [Labilithrix sp.]|nr:hypothetical protein [Labilithrix sp.]MCW5812034.1 hypothetical protein [Labilithrix sp.]
MSSLVRLLPIALLAVACTAPPADEPASSSEANLGEGDTIPTGPLTLDATFATGGTLALEGEGAAIALSRRADGTIAVLRNRTVAETNDVVLTLVKADGSASADVVLPGVESLAKARVLPQADGLVVVGGGARYYAARVGADGALDPTFMPDPLDLTAADVALDASGRIIVSGALAGGKAAVVRLTANGGIDTTFAEGTGAWIDATESPSAASFLALSDGAISFATVTDGTPAVLRLDADGALDASFGDGGRVLLPKGAPAGLVAGAGGALTYFGPTAESPDVHTFAIAKKGTFTAGAKVAGALLDPTSQVSAVSEDDTCILHVSTATTELTAAECAAGVPYVALGEGRRAIAVTTGGAVSVRVFGP